MATSFALLFLFEGESGRGPVAPVAGHGPGPRHVQLRSPGDLKDLLGKAGRPRPPRGTGRAGPGGGPAAAASSPPPGRSATNSGQSRDSRGRYLDALLVAIGQLTGEAKTPAREALAQRLGRMTAHTLNTFMADPDPELRRAAALAAGAKGKDRVAEFADMLVELTADKEGLVAQAARASLKSLTGQDFGPEPMAGPDERTKAAAAWKEWWARAK